MWTREEFRYDVTFVKVLQQIKFGFKQNFWRVANFSFNPLFLQNKNCFFRHLPWSKCILFQRVVHLSVNFIIIL